MQNKYRELLDRRFGMFVHYGIYSAIGGIWKGQPSVGLGEWVQLRSEIPNAEYEAFAKENFLPSPDFAKNLVKRAKDAGVRYIVLTSKHHDGFCLFKSAVDGYNTYDYYGRDICRELVDACNEEGLEVGFYYSHTLDWHEKNGAGNIARYDNTPAKNRNYWDFPNSDIDFEQYFRDKCIPQVKELLTNYGPLKLIWFDFPHDIVPEQSRELRDLVKSLQPDCLINSRIGHGMHDYNSLGDNALPSAPHGVNTECLVTLNHTWGYRSDDHEWKSSAEMISILARTLASDSTILLNVGPMGDGMLTPETNKILEDMGVWTRRNADAIYGNVTANPFPSLFDFGQVAKKDNKIFFYISNEGTASFSVSGLKSAPVKVSLIGDSREVKYSYDGDELHIETLDTDMLLPVYCAEFGGEPVISEEISQNGDNISLGISWAKKINKSSPDALPEKLVFESDQYSKDYCTHGVAIFRTDRIFNWLDRSEMLVWDAEVKEDGIYEAEVVHALGLVSWGATVTKIDLVLSVGAEFHNVGEEKCRYTINRTGQDNTMIVRDAGRFNLTAGKQRFILENLADDNDIPLVTVKFNKIG